MQTGRHKAQGHEIAGLKGSSVPSIFVKNLLYNMIHTCVAPRPLRKLQKCEHKGNETDQHCLDVGPIDLEMFRNFVSLTAQ